MKFLRALVAVFLASLCFGQEQSGGQWSLGGMFNMQTNYTIAVTPSSSTVAYQATGQYEAIATSSFVQNVTNLAAWTSSDNTIATVSAGLASCVKAAGGSVTLTATYLGQKGTASLTCSSSGGGGGTAFNPYCTANSSGWVGPTTDGPANLPTACMNTLRANTPSGSVHAGSPYTTLSALQTAINSGACDIYQVQAGTDLGTGTLTLPANSCTGNNYAWIETTGITDPSWPAEGSRNTPCQFNVLSMPYRAYVCSAASNLGFRIAAANASFAIASSAGNNWRIIGAQITRVSTPGANIVSLVSLTGSSVNHIIFDQDWFAGIEPSVLPAASQGTDTSTTRGVSLGQSNHIAVIDSYFTNFYDTSVTAANGQSDAQCMGGGFGSTTQSGWGVYKFVNNHCEASGEGILLGGSGGPALTPGGCTVLVNCNLDVPTDIEVRLNYFFKPPQWNGNTTIPGGTGWPVVKNGFEMKIGARALFEANVIENVWYNSQVGYCWSTAPKNQSNGVNPGGVGTAPTALTNDFTYRYNYCYNAAYGVGLYQSMDAGCNTCQAQGANRISIHDNVIGDDLNLGSLTGTSAGDGAEFTAAQDITAQGLNQINNVSYIHNTTVNVVRSSFGLGADAAGQLHTWTIQDNLWPYGAAGVIANPSSGGCTSTADNSNKFNLLLTGCVTTYTADHNAQFGEPGTLGANWPTNGSGLGNWFFSSPTASANYLNSAGATVSGTLGFTNYLVDSGFTPSDYALTPGSPLHNAGHDGADVGANISTVTSNITGVRETPPPIGGWSQVSTPASATLIRSFTIDGSNNWYVGDRSTGVWVSTNQGSTWTQKNTGLTGLNAWQLSYDSKHSQIILGMAASGGSVHFYRSSNQGTTWTAIPNPTGGALSSIPNYCCASVDPVSGNLIDGGFYPGSPHIGVWYSTDSGATTHEATTNNLPGGAGQWSTFYNRVTGHLLFGTEQYCLYESTDGGVTYTQVFGPDSDITPGNPHCGNLDGIETDNSGNLLVAAQYGIWKASGTPGGRSYSWTQPTGMNTNGAVNSRSLGHDGVGCLYWGHSHNASTPAQWNPAVFKSCDGGVTWNPFANGLPNLEAWSFTYNSIDGHVYVVIQNGSTNAGTVWRF